MRLCPTTGKRIFYSYGEALAEFDRLAAEGKLDPERGSLYTCVDCEGWHISSRRFMLTKQKGRGKKRSGRVDNLREEGA